MKGFGFQVIGVLVFLAAFWALCRMGGTWGATAAAVQEWPFAFLMEAVKW